MTLSISSFSLHQKQVYAIIVLVTVESTSSCFLQGSDVFSTSTDGRVMWWDIRKLGEPVETLPLEFAGYRPGQKLGGIALEYESSMVSG